MCEKCDDLANGDDRIYSANCGTETIQLDGSFTVAELWALYAEFERLAHLRGLKKVETAALNYVFNSK